MIILIRFLMLVAAVQGAVWLACHAAGQATP